MYYKPVWPTEATSTNSGCAKLMATSCVESITYKYYLHVTLFTGIEVVINKRMK